MSAAKRLTKVATPDAILEAAARLCIAVGSDGLRGELTLMRVARATAAIEGVDAVTLTHLRSIAPMALGHRLRRDPLDEGGSAVRIERAMAELFGP